MPVYVASIHSAFIIPQVRIAAIVLIVPGFLSFPQVMVALYTAVDPMQALMLLHSFLERASTLFLDFRFGIPEAGLLVNRLISNLFGSWSRNDDSFFESAIIGLVYGVPAHPAQLVS